MFRRSLVLFVFALIFAGATVNVAQRQTSQAPQAPPTMAVEAQQALVKQYCAGCHNQNLKSGGMSLTDLDLAHVENNSELAEKVIKKLRVGLMPPSGRPRPDAAAMKNFVTALETTLDRTAALNPNPGF